MIYSSVFVTENFELMTIPTLMLVSFIAIISRKYERPTSIYD